ncbi:MAG: hypothetical protein ABW184_02630 [Sphingobium sp.]
MLALLPLILQAATPVIVTSAAPEQVAVTVYRDPERAADVPLDLGWLGGRALVTETRTIDLPAGPAQIRFEGVADGIVPVSAIVTGLPGGTVETNRDARLLSPAGLVDGSLGRIVHLRRTDPVTGKVKEEDARIVAGPAGGIVLKTVDGILALGCSGLSETPTYDGVPQGLSARPTLSIVTTSPQAVRATIRLSYLADEFDWQADYIARVGEDGRTLDLFAWATLANGNATSFRDAETMAVAGKPEAVEPPRAQDAPDPAVSLQCWPAGRTHEIPEWMPVPPPPLPPPPTAPPAPAFDGDIIVTAQRRQEKLQDVPIAVLVAAQENLGDLKLYRIPEPVTVAANSQKQVAFLTKRGVPFQTIHALLVQPAPADEEPTPQDADILLRLHNREKDGLGLPMPSGRVAVMAPRGDRDLSVGEGRLPDTAVGQEVNLPVAKSAQVQGLLIAEGRGVWRYEVSNANPYPVTVEAVIGFPQDQLRGALRRMERRNGLPLWQVTVPANGRQALSFRTKDKD